MENKDLIRKLNHKIEEDTGVGLFPQHTVINENWSDESGDLAWKVRMVDPKYGETLTAGSMTPAKECLKKSNKIVYKDRQFFVERRDKETDG